MTSDWPRAHVANYFSVSEYLVCEACKLAREKEILVLFYKDGEHLQLMLGAKHYVSIAQNFHQQNCLLLCNLNEFTSHTKRSFPNTRLGCQSFMNSGRSGVLLSPHITPILYVFVLSTKTQN